MQNLWDNLFTITVNKYKVEFQLKYPSFSCRTVVGLLQWRIYRAIFSEFLGNKSYQKSVSLYIFEDTI